MPKRADKSWTEMYKDDPTKAKEMLRAAINAETFLIAAVETTDIDWCIDRLIQVRDSTDAPDTLLEIALGQVKTK